MGTPTAMVPKCQRGQCRRAQRITVVNTMVRWPQAQTFQKCLAQSTSTSRGAHTHTIWGVDGAEEEQEEKGNRVSRKIIPYIVVLILLL